MEGSDPGGMRPGWDQGAKCKQDANMCVRALANETSRNMQLTNEWGIPNNTLYLLPTLLGPLLTVETPPTTTAAGRRRAVCREADAKWAREIHRRVAAAVLALPPTLPRTTWPVYVVQEARVGKKRGVKVISVER